jgi:hypothetical protein
MGSIYGTGDANPSESHALIPSLLVFSMMCSFLFSLYL